MSNENSTTNQPRQKKVTNKKQVRKRINQNTVSRSRRFSCITYLSKLQLDLKLLEHSEQIRCYAYIYHDKDVKEDGTPKEPHYHLIIITHNACTVSAIRRWFSGYFDEKGMHITTTAQVCADVYEMYDYLTHNTPQAIAEGKYQYDKSNIVSNDKEGYFKASAESSFDSITLALESILNHEDIHTLARRYGRDFILHYKALKELASDIIMCNRECTDMHDILEHEYEMEIYKLNNE